jgi:ankyrin repeat protein
MLDKVQEAVEGSYVDVSDCLDEDGSGPLHAAAFMGHAAVVGYLCAHGADVALANATHGWTPLHAAGACGSVPCIETLLAHGADASAGALRQAGGALVCR